jgi:hypothetical protein
LVLHQNAQIATNKISELEILSDEIKPDIFIITEHGFSKESIDFFKIENYTLITTCQRTLHKWGGVAIFTKKNLICSPCKNLHYSEKDFELTGINLTNFHGENLLIYGLYRSPTGNIDIFFDKLELTLTKICLGKQKFAILGDFNIDVLQTHKTETKRLKDLLNTFNLDWSINTPTRVTSSSATAIDNIITNLTNITTSVIVTSLSDHDAQTLEINDWVSKKEPESYHVSRLTKQSNITTLIKCLKDQNWDFLDNIENPNEMFISFNDCFMKHLNFSCPLKTFKSNNKNTKNTWITKGIKVSRQNLKRLHKNFKLSTDEDFKQYFRKYKQIYKRIIRAAKAYEFNKKINTSKNISKTTWSIIKNQKNAPPKRRINLKSNNEIIDDPIKISNIFNRFFSSVAINNTSAINCTTTEKHFSPIKSMLLAPVSSKEIASVINLINSKKTVDLQYISTWLIKQCADFIVEPLSKLINSSFEMGVFPDLLKRARVVPVYKKGDSFQTNNYRPVSILPVFSKIYEKLYLSRLIDFLNYNNLISKNQYGFIQGRSTIDAVIDLLNNIVEGLENHNKTVGVFLDLSKAFDCVDHQILMNKLYNYGVRGVPLNWIKSYLKNREQQVEIEGQLSESIEIKFGVPQGSILGPILFLLYVNECSSPIKFSKIIQYADDTTLCLSQKDKHCLEDKLCKDLNSCTKFFSEINLKVNSNKTNYIYFNLRSKFNNDLNIIINNTIINQVEHIKFLGIHLDRGLTWNFHVDDVCSKVSSNIYAIRNLAKYCDKKTLLTAYFGMIYPHFQYGIIVWGQCSKNYFKRVFVLQKKVLRIMFKLKRTQSCKDTFKIMNLLTLPSIYILEIILFAQFKCKLKKGSDYHTHNTRFINYFRPSQHRLNSYQHLPSQFGSKLYNILPENLKSDQSIRPFKNKLKKFLIDNSFYSVDEFIDHCQKIKKSHSK